MIKNDLPGFVVTLHSGTCEQYAQMNLTWGTVTQASIEY